MIINLKKKTLLHTHTGITLKPGANTVDNKQWGEVRKHPSIKAMLEGSDKEEPTLVEESEYQEEGSAQGENPDGQNADHAHLATMKQPQAVALVKETIDEPLLKQWLENEKRPQVKKAINDQLAKLAEEPEMRDRTQSRQLETGAGPETVELQSKPSAQDE